MFLNEDDLENGYCDIAKEHFNCACMCEFAYRYPTLKETGRLLHHLQKYRRGKIPKGPSPFLVGLAIDESIKMIRSKIHDRQRIF